MKILYVAPRFHSNQVPIIEGLINEGHEVRFIVMRIGANEKHVNVQVDVLQPTMISAIMKKYFYRKGVDVAERKMITWFSPKTKQVRDLLREFKPDVIIMRDRTMFTLKVYHMSKSLRISNCILYNQSPIYVQKASAIKTILKSILFKLFPQKRITTCRYSTYPKEYIDYIEDTCSYFCPFIPRSFEGSREYKSSDPLRILDIGKYRPYKNHSVLIDAAAILKEQGLTSFHISIYGQKDAPEEIEYFNNMVQRANEKGVTEFISFYGSVPYDQVDELMLANDVFVLTSKRELANISIIDAMSFGTAVVATDCNGTSDYIQDGITGLIYRSDDAEDLAQKLEQLMNDRVLLQRMSKAAMCDMRENFNFEAYYHRFMKAVNSSQ